MAIDPLFDSWRVLYIFNLGAKSTGRRQDHGLAAQKPADLIGTWSGEAVLEGQDAPNTLTLVLEIKEGKLVGQMTDQFGAINSEITDIVLETGAFNFSAPAIFPQGEQGGILFKMVLSGDSMRGEIEIPELKAKGTWQATKNK